MSLLFVPADDSHAGIEERANVPGIFLFRFADAFEFGDYSRRNQDNRPDIVTADDGGLRRSLSSQLAESAVRLQSQPAQVLRLLLAHPGEVVARETLRQAVWGNDTFVDFDRGLNFCVAQIRGALGAARRSGRDLPLRDPVHASRGESESRRRGRPQSASGVRCGGAGSTILCRSPWR